MTLEQEFAAIQFAQWVDGLSEADAKRSLIELRELMLKQEDNYKSMLAKAWGIDPESIHKMTHTGNTQP